MLFIVVVNVVAFRLLLLLFELLRGLLRSIDKLEFGLINAIFSFFFRVLAFLGNNRFILMTALNRLLLMIRGEQLIAKCVSINVACRFCYVMKGVIMIIVVIVAGGRSYRYGFA